MSRPISGTNTCRFFCRVRSLSARPHWTSASFTHWGLSLHGSPAMTEMYSIKQAFPSPGSCARRLSVGSPSGMFVMCVSFSVGQRGHTVAQVGQFCVGHLAVLGPSGDLVV